jgi:alkylated DNA repair dioxygenase AlkB
MILLKFNRKNYSNFLTNIPGLFIYNNFITNQEETSYLKESNSINEELKFQLIDKDLVKTQIPQPEEVKIEKYGMQSEETYYNLVSKKTDTKCFYFKKYGDEGHSLIYFKGNENIPEIFKHLKTKLINLEIITSIKPQSWKLTLNFYNKLKEEDKLPGFPFHVDIPINGEITTILSLGSPGLIEFKPLNSDETSSFIMLPRSLVILSGESRWSYMHRVKPTYKEFEFNGLKYTVEIPRVSIVLGCQ